MKHTMLKCLSLVLALATLLSVCAVPALAANGCEHLADDLVSFYAKQEPTCTTPGAEIWLCECGDYVTKNDTYVPALGHTWVLDEENSIPATVNEPGLNVFVCSVCDAEKEVVTTKDPCENDEHEWDKPADCSEDIIQTCIVCGYYHTAEKVGHTMDAGVMTTKPVCGVSGAVYTFTCQVCHETIEETTAVNAGHRWVYKPEVKATCETPGNTAGTYCVYCDAVDESNPDEIYTEVGKLGHNLVADRVDEWRAADCEDGVKYEKCDRDGCTYTKETVLDATIHGNHNALTSSTMVEIQKAACAQEDKDAKVQLFQCTECEEIFTGSGVPAHTYGDTPYDTKLPTCGDWGYDLYFCSSCGKAWADTTGKAPTGNHTMPTDPDDITIVDRACLSDAYAKWTCTVCNQEQIDLDYFKNHPDYDTLYKAYGSHDMVDVSYKAPDCSKLPDTAAANGHTAGSRCSRCDYGTTSVTIEAKHTKSAEPVLVPATCMVKAHKAYICTACSDPENGVYVELEIVADSYTGELDKTNHKNIETHVINTPTCTSPTISQDFCVDCGLTVGQPTVTPAPGHEWGNAQVTVAGTCQNGFVATVARTCTECGEVETGSQVPLTPTEKLTAAAHSFALASADLNADGSVSEAEQAIYDAFLASDTNSDGKHDQNDDLSKVITVGDCEVVGQVEYTCAYCNGLYYITDESTGHHLEVDKTDIDVDCSVLLNSGLTQAQLVAINDLIVAGKTDAEIVTALEETYEDLTEQLVALVRGANGTEGGWDCSRCGHEVPATIIRVEANHDDVQDYGAVTPGHATSGFEAGKQCQTCGIITVEKTYLDPTSEHDMQDVAAKAPTCTADGYVAHKACTFKGCDHKEGYAVANATGHNFPTTWESVAADCGVDGYEYRVCTNGCYDDFDGEGTKVEGVEIRNFVCGYEDHKFVKSDSLSTTEATCTVPEKDVFICEWCGDDKEVIITPATGHHNAAGELISTDCAIEMDRFCVDCDREIATECTYIGTGTILPAQCDMPDREIYVCTTCGKNKIVWIPEYEADGVTVKLDENGNVVYEKGLHSWVQTGHKDASYTEDGYTNYECELCKATDSDTHNMLTGILFDVTVANKNEGQEIVDGSIIAVTITTTASECGVSAITAKLSYNANLFTYVGFAANNSFGEFVPANGQFGQTNCAYAANGVVTIVSISENDDENGNYQNVILDGTQEYATLYFRVANTASASTAAMDFVVSIESARAVDEEGASEPVYTDTDTHEAFEVYQVGNINCDAFIGDEDLEAMQKILLGVDFEPVCFAAADVNQDGEFNLLDFALIQQYVVGAADYDDLANAGTAL